MDTLANALNAIKTGEIRGKSEALLKPASKIIKQVLLLLQRERFIGDFEFVDDGKSGEFVVKLTGKINDCGVVKPRFPVRKNDWEKYEERFLPGRGVGLLIATTPQGIMTHAEAKEKAIGGRLLCFVY